MSAPTVIEGALIAVRTAAAQLGRTVVVGIDGPSGAGKSTLAEIISAGLDVRAAVVEGDDFYADIEWTVRATFAPAEAYERNFDWQRLREQVLSPARNGHSILRYQRYDWDAERMGDWVEIPTPSVLIVEGVYTLRPQLRDLVDIGIWVEAGRDVRIARQHVRHASYEADIAARQDAMMELWEAAESHYLKTDDPKSVADLLMYGEDRHLTRHLRGRQDPEPVHLSDEPDAEHQRSSLARGD